MCLEILITKKEMVLTGHLFWVSVQASINCGPRKALLTKADFMTDRSVVPKRNQTMITHCYQSDLSACQLLGGGQSDSKEKWTV